ncbi:hypothetical protein BP00DRAFT_424249 [Aspergillus indologenus CBS 114.80]|uniref:Uncharacterized protein n=1 Tax=Aspergillus indologenus CBS 114.80 TaxID=1450541 RepID=A0A2V5I907_9EURO|nr:hypothetical protein BP00DRAFT_424249 [Aspergillus indologenus CBS 114.80]
MGGAVGPSVNRQRLHHVKQHQQQQKQKQQQQQKRHRGKKGPCINQCGPQTKDGHSLTHGDGVPLPGYQTLDKVRDALGSSNHNL